MSRPLFVIGLLALSVLGSISAHAQVRDVPACQQGVGVPTLPRLQGYVRDSESKAIAGVRLELVRLKADGTADGTVQTETTDAKGHFRFKRHKDEIYAVRIGLEGRQLEDLKLRQGSSAMLPGGGLMNFVLVVDKSNCVGISLTK